MQSVLAVYVCMYATLCLLLGRVSYSEPFVSLTFYGPRILKINVKQYVLLGESDVTVGCSIEDLPATETNGTIHLYQNNQPVEDVVMSDGNLQLIWNGRPTFSFGSYSSFACEVYLTSDTFTSNIRGSEVVLQQYLEGSDTFMCLPTGAGFLSNEVITIVCLSERGASWSRETEDVLLGTDDNREIGNNFHVTTNNILLKTDFMNAGCRRDGPKGGMCSLELQPTVLNIDIIPDSFADNISFDRIVFTCLSNVPTDRISWRIDSANGNILDFDHVKGSRVNLSITHSFYASQLTVETQVENVISVSCKTSRSGHVAVATVNNNAIRTIIPSSTSVPTQNVSSTQTFHFIIIIVILVVALFFVILFLIFQKLRQSQEKVMGNQVVPRPTADTLPSDNPYYYATSYDAHNPETKNDANKDGNKLEKRSPRPQKRSETVDHLTTDVLGEGAVITLNEAYQIT
ncbi:hypothetical protein HOLleu_38852 [Holothuria leucospilota]|uniref:Ig-like domain-containing protein n=1 Tax=Holothuria leucospilota TaxID=206669 RepID=A0A9Q1BEF5_HOLLE|nr:hypothetical protein HOLleu_38852 [Holothuria leucospilota]